MIEIPHDQVDTSVHAAEPVSTGDAVRQPSELAAGDSLPLEHVETLQEQVSGEDAEGERSVKPASGMLRSGVSAAEAARIRWGADRPRQTSPLEVARQILDRQVRIATGKVQSASAQQQTQAARAVLELQAEVERLELEEQRSTVVDWDAVDPLYRQAVALVLQAPRDEVQHVVDALTGDYQSHVAPHVQGD